MDKKKLFSRLKQIKEELPEEEYPETFDAIDGAIDIDEEILYYSKEEVCQELFYADKTKPMHPLVSELVEGIYQEIIHGSDMDAAADAANDLGALYYEGRIGEQNFLKAVELYTFAANNGCRVAAENLGYCYYYGRDIPRDYEKAFHFFALGAFDGHIISLYKIGDMYRNGYYLTKNEKEAFYIYKRCEDTMTAEVLPLCGADVYFRLAECYAEGIGTEQNIKLAHSYYQKAANMFRDKIMSGDFMMKKNYRRCVEREIELREKLEEKFPTWAGF